MGGAIETVINLSKFDWLWVRSLILQLLTTAVCQRWFTTNSIDSTFLNAWSTSWLCLENKAPRYLVNCCIRSPTLPVDIDDQPTCTAWSFRSVDVAHSVGGPSLSMFDRLEFTACRTAWTGCKQRCLSAHIEDDPVREILVHPTERNWNALREIALYKFIITLTLTSSGCLCTSVHVIAMLWHRICAEVFKRDALHKSTFYLITYYAIFYASVVAALSLWRTHLIS